MTSTTVPGGRKWRRTPACCGPTTTISNCLLRPFEILLGAPSASGPHAAPEEEESELWQAGEDESHSLHSEEEDSEAMPSEEEACQRRQEEEDDAATRLSEEEAAQPRQAVSEEC